MEHQNWFKEVQERIKRVPIASGRSRQWGKISFDDLAFIPAQLSKRPVDYFREKISSETVIGRSSRKPIRLKTPILAGAMSFGALSREAKIALAKATTIAETMANTGEGGMLPEERESAKFLVVQYSTGRFGIDEEVLKKADAIEIKIGQGAKPGQGGLLPKEKITEEIAKIRKVEMGKDVHSPAYHPDIKSVVDLKERIKWLREISAGAPIIIKLAAGNLTEDIGLAASVESDIIAVDGMEGGTGAAPAVLLDEVGLPTLAALVKSRRILDKLGAKQEFWIGGGLYKGSDFAKALALGADAVFVGFPLLAAMGCSYCRMCYLGNCPKGITTQNPELRKNLHIDEAAENVANYIKNCTEEIKMLAGACGESDIHQLGKKHLAALNKETAEITGIDYIV